MRSCNRLRFVYTHDLVASNLQHQVAHGLNTGAQNFLSSSSI
jgi:hypothetical protein